MIVRIKKHHLDYFRRKAKKNKNEIYGVLIGIRISPTIVEIKGIKCPKLHISTPIGVEVDPDSWEEIEDIAKLNLYSIIGGIHSHPNWTADMSKTDVRNHKDNSFSVSGIVGIIKDKTIVRFWQVDSSLPCKIEYYK